LLGIPHGQELDWWALGCVTYEFLMGAPPFCGSSVEEIFQNILSRDIIWPEALLEFMSEDAHDFIDSLLQIDPTKRLGHNGAQEVKAHRWFSSLNWNMVLERKMQAVFTPRPTSETDTSYFEARPGEEDENKSLNRSFDDLNQARDYMEEVHAVARSPSPHEDDAFGSFDSVVLGNLQHKSHNALKELVQESASDSTEVPRTRQNTQDALSRCSSETSASTVIHSPQPVKRV